MKGNETMGKWQGIVVTPSGVELPTYSDILEMEISDAIPYLYEANAENGQYLQDGLTIGLLKAEEACYVPRLQVMGTGYDPINKYGKSYLKVALPLYKWIRHVAEHIVENGGREAIREYGRKKRKEAAANGIIR